MRDRSSRTGRAVLVALGALTIGALAAQPAAAQVYPEPPVQAPVAPAVSVRVVSVLSGSSPTQKTVYANCPAGTRVTGGGGSLIGATQSNVVFTRLEPVQSGTNPGSYVVTATPTGSTGNWRVFGYAVCAS